jgi:zinc protease
LEGTPETVGKLTIEDMRATHAGAFTKDRMYVSVVGDITAKELGPLLDELLGDLPDTGPELPNKTKFAIAGGLTVVDFETPQTVAVWAQSGIERDDQDFFAAYLLNHVLGGSGFTARLTQEVREKRGLTYGVYSYLAP